MTGRPGGIVLDMEGVLHVDWRPIEGSPEAVQELGRLGIELAILTNTTGRTRAVIAERLSAIGFEFSPGRIITAASAAASPSAGATRRTGVRTGRERRHRRSGRHRAGRAPADAAVVLLGGPDETWTYGRLNAVFRVLLEGTPLVAMQRNRWWPTVDGPSLDAGMFVAGLVFEPSDGDGGGQALARHLPRRL